ncbi:hypothetical protein ZWY2020_034674 [Hordeum vulgare]|nr:hypothetical protein ZWY2020_034674 [Hordeum vulgare]
MSHGGGMRAQAQAHHRGRCPGDVREMTNHVAANLPPLLPTPARCPSSRLLRRCTRLVWSWTAEAAAWTCLDEPKLDQIQGRPAWACFPELQLGH